MTYIPSKANDLPNARIQAEYDDWLAADKWGNDAMREFVPLSRLYRSRLILQLPQAFL
jgi:hypothetical protein